MRFHPAGVDGAFIIDVEPIMDERGFFARSWSREEFAVHGLNPALEQCSISLNTSPGIVRGLHYQAAPHEEAKLVRCTYGHIYDVVLDLRPTSRTFRQWHAVELSRENRRALYVPEGCAHGYQSLSDESEVLYQISVAYHPESARGVRWDDPSLAIRWPIPEPLVSRRDRALPLLESVIC